MIAGSDKRGTIYGIYDLSEQIGVSPWYWWADVVPDRTRGALRAARPLPARRAEREVPRHLPERREAEPDCWVRKHYGERPVPGATSANFNSAFYARIFEVILRLKGNYLWPAMWNNAFAEDDPDNPRLADEYGMVMGSSHQEPMLRAQKEWDWHLQREHGNWNYAAHPEVLSRFWREGVRARRQFESIYTIGLRGQNDTAMIHGEAQNIALLEKIVERSAPHHRRGGQPGRQRGAAALVSLQGSAGLLRSRPARAGRRHVAVGGRQLGQPAARAHARTSARGPAAPASTTTSTITAGRAAISGSTPIRCRRSGIR